jgi:hypothetical protein
VVHVHALKALTARVPKPTDGSVERQSFQKEKEQLTGIKETQKDSKQAPAAENIGPKGFCVPAKVA